MTWKESRMSELEALAEDILRRKADLGEEIEQAEEDGETSVAALLRDKYAELEEQYEAAMGELGQLDEGFLPGDIPDYTPSPIEIFTDWF